jgi:hypothetical protein
MKSIVLILSILQILICSDIIAQQLMATINDADILKESEQLFIDKPLKSLLKEIGPEIKMVTVNQSNNPNLKLGYFIFRFVDAKKYDSCRQKNIYPLQITVFIKDSFIWDRNNKNNNCIWTNNDLLKYGEFRVAGIRVFGVSSY